MALQAPYVQQKLSTGINAHGAEHLTQSSAYIVVEKSVWKTKPINITYVYNIDPFILENPKAPQKHYAQKSKEPNSHWNKAVSLNGLRHD